MRASSVTRRRRGVKVSLHCSLSNQVSASAACVWPRVSSRSDGWVCTCCHRAVCVRVSKSTENVNMLLTCQGHYCSCVRSHMHVASRQARRAQRTTRTVHANSTYGETIKLLAAAVHSARMGVAGKRSGHERGDAVRGMVRHSDGSGRCHRRNAATEPTWKVLTSTLITSGGSRRTNVRLSQSPWLLAPKPTGTV